MNQNYIDSRIHQILEDKIAMGMGAYGGAKGIPRRDLPCYDAEGYPDFRNPKGEYGINPYIKSRPCQPYDKIKKRKAKKKTTTKRKPKAGAVTRFSKDNCKTRNIDGKFMYNDKNKCVSVKRHLLGKMRAYSKAEYNRYVRSLGLSTRDFPYDENVGRLSMPTRGKKKKQ
jgi:hypothetical protein